MEALSGGQLGVRSLRDPEVQALLNQARPGWQWEPMLLPPIRRSRALEGDERAAFLRRLHAHPDLQALGRPAPELDGSVIAVRHELADGNHLEAAAWSIREREVLVTYERPVRNGGLVLHSEALRLTVEGKGARLLARSVNGRPTAGTRAGDGTAVQPMSHCPGCSGNC